MNELMCDKTCRHYTVCYKRQVVQKLVPTVNLAEVVLGKNPNQRIEKAGEEAAKELGTALSGWMAKWCPDREEGVRLATT